MKHNPVAAKSVCGFFPPSSSKGSEHFPETPLRFGLSLGEWKSMNPSSSPAPHLCILFLLLSLWFPIFFRFPAHLYPHLTSWLHQLLQSGNYNKKSNSLHLLFTCTRHCPHRIAYINLFNDCNNFRTLVR